MRRIQLTGERILRAHASVPSQLTGEPMRQIRDDAGVEWIVYEVNPASGEWRSIETLPEGYRRGWLCFESPTEKRRLTPLPSGWENLSLEQLGGLLLTAVLVRKPIRYGH